MPGRTPHREHELSKLPDGRLLLSITVGLRVRHTDLYKLEPVPSDWGNAFRLVKIDGRQRIGAMYWCVVGHADEGRPSWCDCPSGQRRGRCRHVETLTALVEDGVL